MVSNADPDVVVIGAGPNGLVAACMLARYGFKVSLFEANLRRPGGAVASDRLTRPGFIHDVGAGFFPFGRSSPAFVELDLEGAGLAWKNARFESCHPALDGSYAAIARDLDLSARHFGSERDGQRWRKLCVFLALIVERLLGLLMGPFPTLGPALKMGLLDLIRVASMFGASGRRLS
jgi:phytoene dehydrogenase-like protein